MENGVWMVNALSKYLRMSINKGPGAVTLVEELLLTENYLGIMRRRFKNAFKVRWRSSRRRQSACCPASRCSRGENALLHGLMHSKSPTGS
jgi:two-component system sensor histidine kinase YesM